MTAPQASLPQRAEAALIAGLLWLVRRLGAGAASDLFGFVARNLGPLLPVNRVGDANLRLAMPELDAASRRRVLRGVWDNLGRTVGEFPFLGDLDETASGPGFEVVNRALGELIVADSAPVVIVGAHYANWEVGPVVMSRLGFRLGFFYRAASNPAMDAIIMRLRAQGHRKMPPCFAKGAQGARQAATFLLRGGHLAMLIDQKLNNGISAPFFGHPAMTTPAAAALALRAKARLIPANVERIGRMRFRATMEEPMALPDTGDRDRDVALLTEALNRRVEAWVRADPTQWLWLHRRWPKEATAKIDA
jgi:Kdo2-lipid IVA lauroyltransferase/acyltransferase